MKLKSTEDFAKQMRILLKSAERAGLCPLCCCWCLQDAALRAYLMADSDAFNDHPTAKAEGPVSAVH